MPDIQFSCSNCNRMWTETHPNPPVTFYVMQDCISCNPTKYEQPIPMEEISQN